MIPISTIYLPTIISTHWLFYLLFHYFYLTNSTPNYFTFYTYWIHYPLIVYTVFFPLTDNSLYYFTIFTHWRHWFLYELLLPIYCSVNYFFPLIPLSTIPCNVLLSISRLFIDNTHCTVHYHVDLVPIQIHVLPTVLHVLRYLQWRTFLELFTVPQMESIGRDPFLLSSCLVPNPPSSSALIAPSFLYSSLSSLCVAGTGW
jgi:hypothetical protein